MKLFVAQYSTPYGKRFKSCYAKTIEQAKAILHSYTPWRRGWSLDSVEERV